jgi:hypothetical protein
MVVSGVVFVDEEARHSAALEFVVAVPFKILLRRPLGGICRQGDFPVFHVREHVGGFTGFVKMPVGDENRIVALDGPQTVIEQPVRVFGQGDAVGEGIVAARGKLVDVGSVHDGAGSSREHQGDIFTDPSLLLYFPLFTGSGSA